MGLKYFYSTKSLTSIAICQSRYARLHW